WLIDWLGSMLLSNDPIGPLDQGDEDLWITKLCAVFGQICFGNSASTRTSPARIDRYFLGHELAKNFGARGPAYRNHRARHRFPHQRDGFAEKKDLHVVASVRKGIAM